MFKNTIIFCVLWMSVQAIFAQSSTCTLSISGTVENELHHPLGSVEVRIISSEKKVLSDSQGHYKVTGLCAGEYKIEFRLLGYDTTVQSISVTKDISLRTIMKINEIHLQDVHVSGVRSEHITQSSTILSEQELEEGKGKQLGQLLSAVAGVNQLNSGNNITKPVINGLHSNRILLLNNGVRQEGQQWGIEHAPEIDPFSAQQIEVVKGAAAVRYGADALGGVILMTPSKVSQEPFLGQVDLIAQSNGRGGVGNIMLEGRPTNFPQFTWRLQSSAKYLGNMKTAEYYMGNTGLREDNISARATYENKRHEVEIFASRFHTTLGVFLGAHVSTIDDIQANIARGRPSTSYLFDYSIGSPRQDVLHYVGKLKWEYLLENQAKISTQYSVQENTRKEYDLRRVLSDDVPMANMKLTTQTLDIAYKKGYHQFGISGMLQINNNVPGTGTTPIIPNFDNHNIGIYGISQFHRNKFHTEIGLRYDYRYFDVAGYRYDYSKANASGGLNQYLLQDQKHFHNVSGTVGLSYHISPQLTLRSNLGLAWRAPSANELYSDGVHHGSGTYEIGDKDLKAEKGLKWTNNITYSTDRIAVKGDVYVQYIDGYIYSTPNPDSVRQTIRGTFPIFHYQQNDAFFYGADVHVEIPITSKWNYSIKASTVKAKDLTNDTYLPFIPSDRIQHGVQWSFGQDERHYIRLEHQFVAEQNRFDAKTDYTYPPPAYHLFHLRASYAPHILQDRIKLNVGVENIFNRLYKDYMDRMRYFTHQTGRNILLNINYKF